MKTYGLVRLKYLGYKGFHIDGLLLLKSKFYAFVIFKNIRMNLFKMYFS